MQKDFLHRAEFAGDVFSDLRERSELDALMGRFEKDRRTLHEGLQDVAQLIQEKLSPDQAAALKTALNELGHRVAAASGGGLFGLAERLSVEEKVAIRWVAKQLEGTGQAVSGSNGSLEPRGRNIPGFVGRRERNKPNKGMPKYAVLVGCGCFALATVFFAVFVAALFLMGPDPEGLSYEARCEPEQVVVGQEFNLIFEIKNTRENETLTIDQLDLHYSVLEDSLFDNADLLSVEPNLERGLGRIYLYGEELTPNQTNTITFKFRARHAASMEYQVSVHVGLRHKIGTFFLEISEPPEPPEASAEGQDSPE